MKLPMWMSWLLVASLLSTLGMFVLWQMAERGFADAVSVRPRGDGEAESEVERNRHAMLDNVINILEKYYDGPVDRKAIVDGALRGAASAVGDRYTELQVPVVASRQREQVEGKFAGIGVVINRRADGTLEVTGVRDDGPAAKAGMKKGDVIIESDGKSLKGLSGDEAMGLIRGTEGTSLVLGFLRGGEMRTVTITRKEMVLESVEGARILDEALKLGYLRITSFTAETPGQFHKALEGLTTKGMERLVLDLRGNGGGSLDASVAVADDLTDVDGAVVCRLLAFSEEAQKRREALGAEHSHILVGQDANTNGTDAVYLGPLVVLVDRNTASASEILAGALQDWGRAFVIGEMTYGKSFVQLPIPLKTVPSYTLKVTVASYVTPLGNWLRPHGNSNEGGIVPDVAIPLGDSERIGVYGSFRTSDEDREATTAAFVDRHLVAAIDVMRGKPAITDMRRE